MSTLFGLLLELADDKCEQVLSEQDRAERWWKPFRDMLIQSSNTKAALLAAITAKSIALKLGTAAAVRYDHNNACVKQNSLYVTLIMLTDTRSVDALARRR